MTLITLATVSVLFVYRRNNANLRSSMADKINSLQTLLQSRCRYVKDFTNFNTQEASRNIGGRKHHHEIRHHALHDRRQGTAIDDPEVFDLMLDGVKDEP